VTPLEPVIAPPRPLRALPKAHLHLHVDGGYPLAAVRDLAAQSGHPFAVPASFAGVDDFFSRYGTVPALVRSHEDLAALCRALVLAEADEGVLYLEPAIEPQLYAERLGGLEQVTRTMLTAFAEASAGSDIEVGAMVTINTDEDAQIADDLARIAAAFAGGGVTALGTACFDEDGDLEPFASAAVLARAVGLPVVSHAGQTGGPDRVEAVLDVLGATRISHGIRAVESPTLLDRLAEEGVVLDVCPTSNVRLGLVSDLAMHPAPSLIAAGVAVTLNADDPLWFGASVTDQYETARNVWGFDDAAIAAVAAAGLTATGMSDATRSRFERALGDWIDDAPVAGIDTGTEACA
jgi:adenosine deaminase